METCLLPSIQYFSNDITIYNNYNNYMYKRLEEGQKTCRCRGQRSHKHTNSQKQEKLKFFLFHLLTKEKYKFFYYIDTSVLLENKLLLKFIKTTSGTKGFIFHNLTREFIDDVILAISLYYFIDVILSGVPNGAVRQNTRSSGRI